MKHRTRGVPLILIILDGWGEGGSTRGNAVRNCHPEALESLAAAHPSTLIDASGFVVGLPEGQIGNSEVGHLCLGAGRKILQDLTRIRQSIKTGELARNEVLRETFRACTENQSALHFMGLVSDGGVHSHIDHLWFLLRLARDAGVRSLRVHAFTDGRDTPPESGAGFLQKLERELEQLGTGRIATVSGRFYAMDRDNRWDRVEKAFEALTSPSAVRAARASDYAASQYARGITDEFLPPVAIGGPDQVAASRIGDGDVVLFFNFRADRAREITRAFTEEDFSGFQRRVVPRLGSFVCFALYNAGFRLPVIFPPRHPSEIFPELIADRKHSQLRIAETEKYAHVTFFFNGGREEAFPGERRVLVPSPRVATYDLQPEMSAAQVTQEVLRAIRAGGADFTILNFANPDMVGHTGVYEAALKACKFVDGCVERIAQEVLSRDGTVCITADHGNAEQMIDPATGRPHTAHTTNPVPLILAGEVLAGRKLRSGGSLADVIPTLLEAMRIDQPSHMTGKSLLT